MIAIIITSNRDVNYDSVQLFLFFSVNIKETNIAGSRENWIEKYVTIISFKMANHLTHSARHY